MRTLRGAAAAVGTGVIYYKRGTSPDSEVKLILRAIVDACADAGIDPRDVDGFCSFGEDTHDGPHLMEALGTRELRWSSLVWGGGGGGLGGAIGSAAAAIATGQADVIAVYRGLAERDSGRLSAAVSHSHFNSHYRAHGIVAPAQTCAIRTMRMLEAEHVPESTMLELVKVCYHHARNNPHAQGFRNTFDEHIYDDARWITEPFGLYDCSRENDGGGCVLLVSAERAKDMKRPPVYVLAAAQGAPEGWGENWQNSPDFAFSGYKPIADRIWAQSGLSPKDIDVLQVYENFSGQAVASIIDHGFCTPASAGEFITFQNLIAPGGKLPTNTNGGNIGEGFVHGIGIAVEAVRQLQGESANPVPDANTCLMVGGPATSCNSSVLFGTAATL